MTDPASHGAAAPAAAWFPDPSGAAQWRWWDGIAWTEHVAPAAAETQVATPTLSVVGRETTPAGNSPRFVTTPGDVPAPAVLDAWKAALKVHSTLVVLGLVVGLPLVAYGAIAPAGGIFMLLGLPIAFAFPGWLMNRAIGETRRSFLAAFFAERGITGPPRMVVDPAQLEERLPIVDCGYQRTVAVEWSGSGVIHGFDAECGSLWVRWYEGKARNSAQLAFVAIRLPSGAAARHPAVSVRPRLAQVAAVQLRRHANLWGNRMKGRKLPHESAEVERTLSICVHEATPELNARELFGPQLLARLAERPVAWDQEGELLLVLAEDVGESMTVFDALCDDAAAVARAYWSDQA